MSTINRQVTDEEFRRAYYGIPGDLESQKAASDNQGIVKSVLRKYAKQIPRDDLELCGLHAVWRCLQKHDHKYGQKFTTSLHRFAHWECLRQLQKIRVVRNKSAKVAYAEVAETDDWSDKNESLEHIRERMKSLPFGWQRQVVDQYYFQGMTIEEIAAANGYNKELARKRVHRATYCLRQICLDGVVS